MNLFFLCIFFYFVGIIFCKPNVLLIVIDDLRPNLGAYGYKSAVTPNLDSLASKSFVFSKTFCQQALCAPSRNSLLTSRRPDTLHLYDFYNYWRESVGNFTTLPQHFKQNGYYTQSIGKIFHPGISSNFSDDMPYSWSGAPFHPKTQEYMNSKVCFNNDGTLGKNVLCPVRVMDQPGGTLPDIESLNYALNFLENEKNITGGLPYFLAVGFHKPHLPLKFPEEYLEQHPIWKVVLPSNRWRSYSLPNVAWNPWTDIRDREDVMKLNVSFPFGQIPDYFLKKIIQHYDAAVTYIDDLIGRILKKIEGTNTIIVITSDHGWSAGEHGEFSKYSNFDISTRVPLIIHVPGLSTHGIVVEQITELVDLFPTLVDLTNISPPIPICNRKNTNIGLCTEGRSLVYMMVKSKQKKMPIRNMPSAFSQYPRPGDYPTKFPNSDKPRMKNIKIMGYSIRTERHRYTEWVEFNRTSCKPNWLKKFGTELYDHSIDPGENMNLIDRKELVNVAKDLRKQLILGWRYMQN
ncbi:hypothetical protein HHI36_011475 [Cryptolaemus montrouzieri]|uniref:Sulfatase N-terminal domain-containing protein n=1 Tax=Cryptolaemus montrouzieri TaxID=559131 RepID=A0ABD2MLY6_9CUCU